MPFFLKINSNRHIYAKIMLFYAFFVLLQKICNSSAYL